jgi:hypothetical protein
MFEPQPRKLYTSEGCDHRDTSVLVLHRVPLCARSKTRHGIELTIGSFLKRTPSALKCCGLRLLRKNQELATTLNSRAFESLAHLSSSESQNFNGIII